MNLTADEEVNLGTGLNDAFEVRGKQQQNYGLQERGREEEEDPHLREFLERQMAQKRARELGAGKERDPFARGPGEAGVPGDAREMKNLEEMLYQIPEHLRVRCKLELVFRTYQRWTLLLFGISRFLSYVFMKCFPNIA